MVGSAVGDSSAAASSAGTSTATMGGAAIVSGDMSADGAASVVAEGVAVGGATVVEISGQIPSLGGAGWSPSRKRKIEQQDRQDIADIMAWLESDQWREAA